MRPSPKSDPGGFTWITLPAVLASLEPIRRFVVEEAETAALRGGQMVKLELVLEEVVVNVMRHAYPPDAPGAIEVGCRGEQPGQLCVQVRDAGRAFDPLSRPEEDLSLGLDERPAGKMGIFLVKRLTQSVSYERSDGLNILTFRVGADPDPSPSPVENERKEA